MSNFINWTMHLCFRFATFWEDSNDTSAREESLHEFIILTKTPRVSLRENTIFMHDCSYRVPPCIQPCCSGMTKS